jgi:hypothetical protein
LESGTTEKEGEQKGKKKKVSMTAITHQIIKKNDMLLSNSEIFTYREAVDVAEKSNICLPQTVVTSICVQNIGLPFQTQTSRQFHFNNIIKFDRSDCRKKKPLI